MDRRLVDGWTTEGERSSVRALTHDLNRRVLESGLTNAGVTPTGTVEHVYAVLDGREGRTGARQELVGQLERDGVDVDAVTDDFVSHQTVYRHLTTCLGVSHGEAGSDPNEPDLDHVRALRGRLQAVTRSTLDQSVAAGNLAERDYDVLVEVTVLCTECGSQYSLPEVVEAGGCTCDRSSLERS